MEEDDGTADDFVYFVCIDCTVLVLTLATFIYGVTSWCILKKIRHFKNYVYLNLILSSVFIYIPIILLDCPTTDEIVQIVTVCIYLYLKTVYTHWLLVLCYICYVDIVKVFQVDIRRRYLKSAIFAWAVPVITVSSVILLTCYFIQSALEEDDDLTYSFLNLLFYGSVILPLLVNFILYLIIVFSLCRSNSTLSSVTNKWRRFYMATFIFLLSDIISLYSFILTLIVSSDTVLLYMTVYLQHLQTIVLNVFFIAVKSNRQVWREYYLNNMRQKMETISIENLSRTSCSNISM